MMQRKEILHVDRSYEEGDAAQPDLDGARETDQEEHVEPSRHEGKIHHAADEDERPGDQSHLPSILKIDKQ